MKMCRCANAGTGFETLRYFAQKNLVFYPIHLCDLMNESRCFLPFKTVSLPVIKHQKVYVFTGRVYKADSGIIG